MRQNGLAASSAFEWPDEHALHHDRTGASETPLVARNGAGPRATDGVRSMLDRGDLLQWLDRALSKRVTVLSAPAGSGKTSLLRAWADRSTNPRRVAFVSVDRGQQDAQRFWGSVLGA